LAKTGSEGIVNLLNSLKLEKLKVYLDDPIFIKNLTNIRNDLSDLLKEKLYKYRLASKYSVSGDNGVGSYGSGTITGTPVVLKILKMIDAFSANLVEIQKLPKVKENEDLSSYLTTIAPKILKNKELLLGSYNILDKSDFKASDFNEGQAKGYEVSKEDILKLLKTQFGKIQNMDGQFGKYESYINGLDNSNPHKTKLKEFCDYYRNGLVRKLYWALEKTIGEVENIKSNFLSESIKTLNYNLAQLTAPYTEEIKFAKPADLAGITAYVGSFISQVQPFLTKLSSKFK